MVQFAWVTELTQTEYMQFPRIVATTSKMSILKKPGNFRKWNKLAYLLISNLKNLLLI